MAPFYFRLIPLLSTRGRHVVLVFPAPLPSFNCAKWQILYHLRHPGSPQTHHAVRHAQSWLWQPTVPSAQKVPSPPTLPSSCPVNSSLSSPFHLQHRFLKKVSNSCHSPPQHPASAFPTHSSPSNQLDASFSDWDAGVNRAETTLVSFPIAVFHSKIHIPPLPF